MDSCPLSIGLQRVPQLENDRYERFCLEYVIDLNGTRAATAAGFSPKGARFRASELLKRSDVADRISELKAKQQQRLEITADRVLLEVARVAFATMGDFGTWGKNGVTLIDSDKLTPDQMAAVLEVSEGENKRVSIKLHSKVAALDRLMKHLGLLKDQVDVHHSGAVRFIPPEVIATTPGSPQIEDSDSKDQDEEDLDDDG